MHLALIISLGAQFALGYYRNSSEPYLSPHVHAPPPHKHDAQPLLIGDFRLVGCVASTAGLPNFKKVASTEVMSLDFCAASCPGRFFGTYNTDCYCGDELGLADSGKVTPGLCDTPCPGDECQACGGLAASARLAREKQRPLSIVLSLYIRIDENHHHDHDHDHGNEHSHHRHGGITATRPPHHTFTSTITSTATSTVTSCPPGLPHCSVGHKITKVVTVTTELCPKPEWHRKKIVCFGSHCAPEEPCRDEHCEHHRVICNGDDCYPEVCTDKDEWHKLVICNDKGCRYHQCTGDECNTKIICYDGKCAKETCYGDECRSNFVCKGLECGHEPCNGDDCYKYEVCNADCRHQPPCNGAGCPVPPPPAPRPDHPAPTHNRAGHDGSHPYPSPPVPALPTTVRNLPHPTQPPVIAGSTKLGTTFLPVLLSFIIFL